MVASIANDNLAIYPIEQAARLARLSPRILRRWLDGDSQAEPAFQRRIPANDAGVIGFLDLVQALAIRALRKDKKLSLQKVRQTVLEAEKLGINYPFARQHQTFLFEDDVVLKVNDELIQVTGKYRQQQLIKPVVEVYLYDLHFDHSGLADVYTPLRDNERSIVIKPTIKYGAPIVSPCGYTVSALIAAVESEGSIASAAEAYYVEQDDVKLALRYDDYLMGIAA